MRNLFDIPKPQNGFIDIFTPNNTNFNSYMSTWEKPSGIIMIRILCIGGGGGGSSGFPSATATAR